jgi:stage II sporulation protein GA (sporulation sigma-E factor processing peptidase)
MEIYLDVLILENIVMNYLILWTSGKLSKMETTNLRLFVSSVIGALYAAFLITNPSEKGFYALISKIALSIIMIIITFPSRKLALFIKVLIVFYITTFTFAGTSFALIFLNNQGSFIRNGIIYIYWHSKWITIFLSTITAFILLKVFKELVQYRLIKDKLLTKLRIKFENRQIDVKALIDTGNSLYDPISNMPVIVVEFNVLKSILPPEVCKIFDNSDQKNLEKITDQLIASKWVTRFRLIPFSSIGKENGMLIGFRPDYVEIGDDNRRKKSISSVIIGIYNHTLSKEKYYGALLSPDLI